MRGSRIYDHTEKVGGEQRKGPWCRLRPSPDGGGAPLGLQGGGVLKEFPKRRRGPTPGEGIP